jgi:hypothetical protein
MMFLAIDWHHYRLISTPPLFTKLLTYHCFLSFNRMAAKTKASTKINKSKPTPPRKSSSSILKATYLFLLQVFLLRQEEVGRQSPIQAPSFVFKEEDHLCFFCQGFGSSCPFCLQLKVHQSLCCSLCSYPSNSIRVLRPSCLSQLQQRRREQC